MNKLRLNDEVIVIAGKDKSKTGKITKINNKTRKVYVEGINLAKKAVKADQANPNGGFVSIEAALDMSNVMVVSPKTNKGSRVGIRLEDGKSARYLKSCGTVL
jgi:large subunit ribosomal protein L24